MENTHIESNRQWHKIQIENDDSRQKKNRSQKDKRSSKICELLIDSLLFSVKRSSPRVRFRWRRAKSQCVADRVSVKIITEDSRLSSVIFERGLRVAFPIDTRSEQYRNLIPISTLHCVNREKFVMLDIVRALLVSGLSSVRHILIQRTTEKKHTEEILLTRRESLSVILATSCRWFVANLTFFVVVT